MGGRLAYLKEKSRRRASKHRLGTQEKRTRESLGAQLTWALRFNQPGSGKKTQVFPLAEGALKDEVAAAPLSRHARNALLQEDPHAELPEVRARTRTLPPTEKRVTEAKKKKKHRKERKREQRRKAEKAERVKGRVGHLAALSGGSAPSATPGWTRVDFVVDSGASATTLPRKLLGDRTKLKKPVGYRSFRLADGNVVENRSFRLADGNVVENEGTLETKAWLMGDETLEIRASVAAISQPLLSVGQVTSRGNRVLLGVKVSYLETTTGKKHRIFLKNGVYVLPVWMDTANSLFELSPHPFVGRGDARL